MTLQVPKGAFSKPSIVKPANKMPGGGLERTANGKIPTKGINEKLMKNRKKISAKLNIIEPWEFGTEVSIDVDIIDENNDIYLISLPKPRLFKDEEIKYMVFELREKSNISLLSNLIKGNVLINMVFSKTINIKTFKQIRISDFRNNFLLGELTI